MNTNLSTDAPALTAEGRDRLQQRLARTSAEIADLDALIKAGDATDEQVTLRRLLEEQAFEIERLLVRARDIGSVQENPDIVEVGDEVDVRFDDGDTTTYALVHPAEVSGGDNRISAASPLGQALLGHAVGDRVVVHAPAGPYACTVLARRRLA